ncbi:MAG TPA: CvpA family protein [Chloroflexia bacterium]|nr:CvpA family protein [Chloroflexia bacterium]
MTEIFTLFVPVFLALVFALFGVLRGAWREAIVSAAIVLAALINKQWAERWATDLNELSTGIGRDQAEFWLSVLIMGLVVVVVGYILGSALIKGKPSATSRMLGGLLGLLNGSALAGWLLLSAYVSLDGAQATSPIYQSSVAQGFMIAAGWSPVALAVIAAIVALIAPLRRAQSAVGRPAESTNWTPATAGPPVVPAPDRSAYAPAYAPSYPPIQPSAIVPPAAPVETRSLPDYSAPPPAFGTTQSQQPGLPVPMAQSQLSDADTRSFPPIDSHDRPTLVNEQVKPAQPSQPPAWGEPSEPSWLVGPAAASTPVAQPAIEPAASEPAEAVAEPSQSADEYAAQPMGETSAPDGAETLAGDGTIPCPNCGTTLQADAYFCTECGTRVKS